MCLVTGILNALYLFQPKDHKAYMNEYVVTKSCIMAQYN